MRLPAPSPARDPYLLVVALVAGLLLLWNLGGRFLWQDEAETALLAKSILRTGLPIAFDGTNVVSQEAGREFGPTFLWRWSPWVQYYLAAASISLLGATPLAARLPFAILGWLAVPGTYLLARRLTGSIVAARAGSIVLALSVPFLLHARQARWHAPACLLAIGLLLSVDGLAKGSRRASWLLVASGTLLFYTNYFVAIGLCLAVLVAGPLLRQDREFVLRLVALLAGTGVLCLPGVLFFEVLGKTGPFEPAQKALQLWAYFASGATFLLPLPMLIVPVSLALLPSGPARGLEPAAANPLGESFAMKRASRFLLLLCGVYLVYVALGPWWIFRYLIVLAPPAAVLLGLACAWLVSWNRAAGLATGCVLVLTNLLHLTPFGFAAAPGTVPADRFPSVGFVGSPLAGYLYEVTHRFDDPELVLCRYLRDHAAAGETLLITYGDLPLEFCTELTVVGGLQGRPLPEDPDWIVVRHFILSTDPGKDLDVMRFIQAHVDPGRYETIDLGADDTRLGNNPDPFFHLFRPPAEAPPLTLLRRVRGA